MLSRFHRLSASRVNSLTPSRVIGRLTCRAQARFSSMGFSLNNIRPSACRSSTRPSNCALSRSYTSRLLLPCWCSSFRLSRMMCFVSHMTRLWTICMVAISYIPLLQAGFSRVCDRVQLQLRLRPVHLLSHTRSACTGCPASVLRRTSRGSHAYIGFNSVAFRQQPYRNGSCPRLSGGRPPGAAPLVPPPAPGLPHRRGLHGHREPWAAAGCLDRGQHSDRGSHRAARTCPPG